jgi:hypothetical protein
MPRIDYNPIVSSKASVCVKDNGAQGDGTTDDTDAFLRTYAKLPTNGGIIDLGDGQFVLQTDALILGDKPVVLRGCGWIDGIETNFGNNYWKGANATPGSTLLFQGNGDGILLGGTKPAGVIFQDLGIVGPGTGSGNGINSNPSSGSCRFQLHNVHIANFNTGLGINGATFTCDFYGLRCVGCNTGVYLGTNCTDLHFYMTKADACGTGILIEGGQNIQFVGGTIQGNVNGINIAPPSGSFPIGLSFDTMYLETNSGIHFQFDTTNSAVTNAVLTNCRFGGGGGTDFNVAGTHGVNVLVMMNTTYGHFTFPSTVANAVLIGNNFSSLTDNSTRPFIVDPVNVGAKIAGVLLVDMQNGKAGFFGAPPVGKQTLSGVLSGVADANAKAVLTSLVNAVAALGLATNSTT